MLRRPTRPNGALPSHGGTPGGGTPEYGYGNVNMGSPYGGYSGGGGSNSDLGVGVGSPYGGYSGGMGGSSSSSSSSSNRRGHYNKNTSSNPILRIISKLQQEPWIFSIVLVMFFFVLSMYYRSKYNSIFSQVLNDQYNGGGITELKESYEKLKISANDRQRQVSNLQEQNRNNIQKQAACERDKRTLQKEKDELRLKYDNPEKINAQNRLVTRESAWKDQVDVLKAATQRESSRSVVDKFGSGPHYVEITVDITSLPEDVSMKSFVVELAPLSLMPHSVHLFLEQVSHNLWNNAWFYINGPHVLQAGPQADDDILDELHHQSTMDGSDIDERAVALAPFKEKFLDSLAFPEYSNEFPHVQWSMGFTGRPGGPDFYINKVDNSVAHGPGGQNHHELDEFADPCFAKIYSGFTTLEAIFNSPTVTHDSTYKYFFEDPVHIVGTKILTTKPEQSPYDRTVLKIPDNQNQNQQINPGQIGNDNRQRLQDSILYQELLKKQQQMEQQQQGGGGRNVQQTPPNMANVDVNNGIQYQHSGSTGNTGQQQQQQQQQFQQQQQNQQQQLNQQQQQQYGHRKPKRHFNAPKYDNTVDP